VGKNLDFWNVKESTTYGNCCALKGNWHIGNPYLGEEGRRVYNHSGIAFSRWTRLISGNIRGV